MRKTQAITQAVYVQLVLNHAKKGMAALGLASSLVAAPAYAQAQPSAQAHILMDQLIAQQEARQAAQEAQTAQTAQTPSPTAVATTDTTEPAAQPQAPTPAVTTAAAPTPTPTTTTTTPKTEPSTEIHTAAATTPTAQPQAPTPAVATATAPTPTTTTTTPKTEPSTETHTAAATTPAAQPQAPTPAVATATAPTPAATTPKATPQPATVGVATAAPTPKPATTLAVAKRTPVRDSIVRVAVPARKPFAHRYNNSTNQQAKMLADMLYSRVAFVMDQNNGKTLLNKNGRHVTPIASITKLMTAVITLDANLPMDEMITISEADIDTIKRSRSRLPVGTTLSRQKMLHLALMSSENRAANALARYYPGGMPAAIRAMNQRAIMLGMRDTRYVEPTGLSSQNQSSARDLALLVRAAYRYPLIRNYTTYPLEHFDVNGKMLRYNNTNRLVHSIDWDIGLQKTGFISEAGRCVVMQSTIAGRNIIIVLLDSPNNNRRAEDADAIRYFVQNATSPSSWSRSGRVAGIY